MNKKPLHRVGASKVAIIAVVALLGVAALSTALYMRSGSASQENNQDTTGEVQALGAYTDTLPSSWGESNPDVIIDVSPTSDGITLDYGNLSYKLHPKLDQQGSLDWQKTEQDGQTLLVARSTWRESPVVWRWEFTKGDPQIGLSIELESLPAHLLGDPITATIELPSGELTHYTDALYPDTIQDSARLNSWGPRWAQWSSGSDALTVTGWDSDEVLFTHSNDSNQIELVLWDPAAHPPVTDCEEGAQPLRLQRRVDITIGRKLPVLTSRLEAGYQAGVAPVFLEPKFHPVEGLTDAGSADARSWSKRIKTLLHGYSAEDDPRFGNGGLLGLELGGAIAVPAAWADDPVVAELAETVKDTRVELLFEGKTPSDQHATLVNAHTCASSSDGTTPVLELGTTRGSIRANSLRPGVALTIGDAAVRDRLPGFIPGKRPTMTLDVMNGQRKLLTRDLLSQSTLQQLIEARGINWFAAPLVATRNPLTPAAKEALLSPERRGNWTLSSHTQRALGGVELASEQERILFSSPAKMSSYWASARQVVLRELPDGSVAAINPNEAITGFTLIAPGHLTPTVTDAELSGAEVLAAANGDLQTWFWFDLPHGVTRVDFQEQGDPQENLTAIFWRFQP